MCARNFGTVNICEEISRAVILCVELFYVGFKSKKRAEIFCAVNICMEFLRVQNNRVKLFSCIK